MHRIDTLSKQITRQLQGEAGLSGSDIAAVNQQPAGLLKTAICSSRQRRVKAPSFSCRGR